MAGEGAKLATAYFELIPSMRGSEKAIRGLVPTLGATGVLAGASFGRSFAKATSSANLGQAAIKKLQSDVASASSAVTQSRLRELDATGKVRVATAALNEVSTKYGATSSRTIASQERLATAQRGLAQAHGLVQGNTSRLTTAQNALTAAQDSSTRSTGRFRTAMQNVGSSIGTSFDGGMKQVLAVVGGGITAAVGIAAAGALTIAGTVGAAFDAGFTRLSTIETAQAKLRALGNSAETIAEIMTDANNAVTGTQYSLADAVTAAANATAAGIQPGQDLTSYLKLQANAAALAGVGFSDLGLVMNQVQSQNKAYTQDLNQVASRGIPIYQSLAKVYGISIADLRDKLAKGEVDADHFRQALTLNVGNAADEIGKTTVGSFENMKAAFSRFGAVLIGPVFPLFNRLFSGVISGLDSFAKILKPIVEVYGPKLQAIIQPVADSIGPAFASFFGDLQKAASSPEGKQFMTDMGKALKDIGGALVQALPSALKFTEQALKLVGALILLGAQAAPAWIHGAQQIMDFTNQVVSNMKTAISSISDGTFWSTLWAKMQNGLNQISTFFTTWWTNVMGGAAANGWAQITGVFANGWNQLITGTPIWLGQLGVAFGNGWNQITVAFGNGWAQWQVIAANGWAQLVAKFQNGGAQILAAFANGWAQIQGAFANGWAQIQAGAASGWAGVVGAFRNGWSQITSFFANAGSWLYTAGANIVHGLANGVRDAIGGAVSAAASAAQQMLNAAKNVLGIHSPSTAFHQLGIYSMQGFANGVTATRTTVTSAVKSAVAVPSVNSGAFNASAAPSAGGGVHIGQIVAPDQDPRVAGRVMGREIVRVMAGEV